MNWKPCPNFQVVPVLMTLSDLYPDFKVTVQCQITRNGTTRAILTMAD